MQMYQRSTGVTDIRGGLVGGGLRECWEEVECVCVRGGLYRKVFGFGCTVWTAQVLYRVVTQGGGCLGWRGVDTANAVKWSPARSRGLGGGEEG